MIWKVAVNHTFTSDWPGEDFSAFCFCVCSGFFPKDILWPLRNVNTLRKTGPCSQTLSFSLCPCLRQENQKLKELVTGGVAVTAAPSDTETLEAKDEPVKEESSAVRPKMEVSTPQKVFIFIIIIIITHFTKHTCCKLRTNFESFLSVYSHNEGFFVVVLWI